MNAFAKTLASVLLTLASVCAFAQTEASTTASATPTPPTLVTKEAISVDLPKELKGYRYWWSGGNRFARDMSLVFTDITNPNDIKGVVTMEDRDCPTRSFQANVEKVKISGGILEFEVVAPKECADSDQLAMGELRFFFTLPLEKNNTKWKAGGIGVFKSQTKELFRNDVRMTSP